MIPTLKKTLLGIYFLLRCSPLILYILSVMYGLDVMAHYEHEGCEVVWFNSNDARRTETMALLAGSLASLALGYGIISNDLNKKIPLPRNNGNTFDKLKSLTFDYIFSEDVGFGNVFLLISTGCMSAAIWFTLNGALTGACVDTVDTYLIGQVPNLSTYAWIMATLIFTLSIVNSGFSIVKNSNDDEFTMLLRKNTLVGVIRSVLQFTLALYLMLMLNSNNFITDYVNDGLYEDASCQQATTNGVFDSGPSKLFRDTLELASTSESNLGVVSAKISDTMFALSAIFIALSAIDLVLTTLSWIQLWMTTWNFISDGQTSKPGFFSSAMKVTAIPKSLNGLVCGCFAGVFVATLILENAVAGCPFLDSKFEQVDAMYNVLTTYVAFLLAEAAWNAAIHDRHADMEVTGERLTSFTL